MAETTPHEKLQAERLIEDIEAAGREMERKKTNKTPYMDDEQLQAELRETRVRESNHKKE